MGNLICIEGKLNLIKINYILFYRIIKWYIHIVNTDLKISNVRKSQVALQLNVPNTLFVNSDELADLQRQQKLSSLILGDVNIETIAEESRQHVVYLFLNDFDNDGKMTVKLPIHVRYHKAQENGGYVCGYRMFYHSAYFHCIQDMFVCSYRNRYF